MTPTKAQLALVVALCTIFGAIGTLVGKVFTTGEASGVEAQRIVELERRVDKAEDRLNYNFGKER